MILLVWFACTFEESPRPPKTSPPEAPIAADRACDSLSRQECLRSDHCTLHHLAGDGPAQYECRADVGACEVGIHQEDKAACTAQPQCTWQEANCYCPFPGYGQTKVPDTGSSGGACACGGGSPALCRSSTP